MDAIQIRYCLLMENIPSQKFVWQILMFDVHICAKVKYISTLRWLSNDESIDSVIVEKKISQPILLIHHCDTIPIKIMDTSWWLQLHRKCPNYNRWDERDFNGISMLFEYLISIEKTFFVDNVSFLKWLENQRTKLAARINIE